MLIFCKKLIILYKNCLLYTVLLLLQLLCFYCLLYVSKYKEEWQTDREDLKEGLAFSYVYNMDCPEFSEFGSIGFAQRFGGLVRTA